MHQYLVISPTLKLPLYNIMLGIGCIFAFLFLEKQLDNQKCSDKKALLLYLTLIISGLFGFFGAKMFEMLYKNQALSWHNFIHSGFTFYGGIIMGSIALIFLSKCFKFKIFSLLNTLTPCVIIAHAWGRIGCFLGGCCFGKITSSFLGVQYPENSLPFLFYKESVKIHPVQLYESAFLFILFFVINKIQFKNRFCAYLIIYGIIRFLLEFLRGDFRGTLLGNTFSPSQIISLLCISLGLGLYYFYQNKNISIGI